MILRARKLSDSQVMCDQDLVTPKTLLIIDGPTKLAKLTVNRQTAVCSSAEQMGSVTCHKACGCDVM